MHLIRVTTVLAITLLAFFSVSAQAQTDLTAANIQIVNGVGDFGQPVVEAVGQLTNGSSSAYTTISLDAKAYNAQDQLVG